MRVQAYKSTSDNRIDTRIEPASPMRLEKKKNMSSNVWNESAVPFRWSRSLFLPDSSERSMSDSVRTSSLNLSGEQAFHLDPGLERNRGVALLQLGAGALQSAAHALLQKRPRCVRTMSAASSSDRTTARFFRTSGGSKLNSRMLGRTAGADRGSDRNATNARFQARLNAHGPRPSLHDRMPVIPRSRSEVLKPPANDVLRRWAVSRRVIPRRRRRMMPR
jgi:hypothetical protein